MPNLGFNAASCCSCLFCSLMSLPSLAFPHPGKLQSGEAPKRTFLYPMLCSVCCFFFWPCGQCLWRTSLHFVLATPLGSTSGFLIPVGFMVAVILLLCFTLAMWMRFHCHLLEDVARHGLCQPKGSITAMKHFVCC